DVGNAYDDYVGCNIERGLGFGYNGDADDEQSAGGYGLNPPALGMDFFQGPLDEFGNELSMSKFVYYENDWSLRGNPEVAAHYYGYLRGFWKDGSPMTYGGNGYGGTVPTDFMYPGDAGGCEGIDDWSEASVGNPPDDRRFLESAGPFTLQPGAKNEIITGMVWARGNYNDHLGSLCELFKADDLAQALFDANFQLLDGPDAPELAVAEYDQELILTWDYSGLLSTNNHNESYAQTDPVLASQNETDSIFEFQGYLVYQLKDATVSASELQNTERARIVAQCDIQDGVTAIVNETESFVPGLEDPVIVQEVMVNGEDNGIFRSVRMTEDLFAEGADRRLKNYTTYHYGVVAYAYNEVPSDGQSFVQGNRGFQNTSAVPHKIDFENFGTVVNSEYGEGVQVRQIAGVGNGGNEVRLTPESEAEIVANGQTANITYARGYAPIQLKVVNPKEVRPGDYRLEVVTDEPIGDLDTVGQTSLGPVLEQQMVEWRLFESGEEIFVSTYVQQDHPEEGMSFRPQPLSGVERIIAGHGFSIAVENPEHAGVAREGYDPVIMLFNECGKI
ncbi:MAG: hypothetical protein AAF570_17410, partial [Bacteroidota bacterium]